MFVTNFVFQLPARSEILLYCLEHIALPKVQVVSIYAIRSRRECGDFQRPIERQRHSELALYILILVFCIFRSLKWISGGTIGGLTAISAETQNGALNKGNQAFPLATKIQPILMFLLLAKKYNKLVWRNPQVNFLPPERVKILTIHAKVDRKILTRHTNLRQTWDAGYRPELKAAEMKFYFYYCDVESDSWNFNLSLQNNRRLNRHAPISNVIGSPEVNTINIWLPYE